MALFRVFSLTVRQELKKINLQWKLDRFIMMWKLCRLNEVSYLSLLRFLHPCRKISTCLSLPTSVYVQTYFSVYPETSSFARHS